MKPNKVQKTVELQASVAVTVADQYADVMAVAKASLDAKAIEADKALPGTTEVRNALFNSLALFILASGYSKDEKLDKDTKVALKTSWDGYRTAVRTEAAVIATVNGQSAEIVKLGRERISQRDANGIPVASDMAMTARRGWAVDEQERWVVDNNATMLRAIAAKKAAAVVGK